IDLFRDGEHFSTFSTRNFLDHYADDSTSLDGVHDFSTNNQYDWDMENEREINGDIALIPVSSSICETMNNISESPPCNDDFQKIMNDWQHDVCWEYSSGKVREIGSEDFSIDDPIIIPEENNDETVEQKSSPLHEILNLPSSSTFDITTYLNEEEPKPVQNVPVRKPKAGMKKIDLKAQRYIVEEDEDDVDVETISECGNSPVLEAVDLNSLLEQFEATEMPEVPSNFIENSPDLKATYEKVIIKEEPIDTFTENSFTDKNNVKCKPEVVKVKKEPMEKDVLKIKKRICN
ncbi:hypothetical protein NQ314_019125, partial [Rhamnusium bicolor]